MIRLVLLFLVFLGILTDPVAAQTLRPHVALVQPSGGQRGTTVTVTITGANIGYGTEVRIDAPGITVEQWSPEVPPAGAKNPEGKGVARLKIAENAPLGRFPLRVITPLGPSDIGYFVVGEWPQIGEKEPNNTREQAQAVNGPVTILGASDGNEDVDYYRISLNSGETIVCSAASASIGSAMLPILTLRDLAGNERAFAATLKQRDAVLTFTSPTKADYLLMVRDLRYQGAATHFYRLTVGRIPAVTSVFPMGGMVGSTPRVTLAGYNLPNPAERYIPLPGEIPFAPIPLPDVGNRLIEVSESPEVNEQEKNDTPESAQAVTAPVTVNGRIYVQSASQSDTDCFRFHATKGQVFSIEVMAARLGSPLDSMLSITDIKGNQLAANDDANGPDSALSFTAPDNGDFVARITDLNGKSGEDFTYRLHITPALPDFRLTFFPDCPSVAPNDRVQVTINSSRLNGFDADIPLAFTGLPNGFRFIGAPVIPRGQSSVTLLATVDNGAPSVTAPLSITGTATMAGKTVTRRAQSHERSYIKENDQLKQLVQPVPFPMVSITGPADLILNAAADKTTLAIGKTVELKVTVVRKADFTAKIPIIVQGLPTGVTVTGNEIAEKANEATLTFKAEGNAMPGEYSLTILARSVVDELRFTEHSAQPMTLTVVK